MTAITAIATAAGIASQNPLRRNFTRPIASIIKEATGQINKIVRPSTPGIIIAEISDDMAIALEMTMSKRIGPPSTCKARAS